ncbi:hypothetical protein C2E31_01205 [Rhodopirellula baltica]|nr:hypothetical protein C2E31_01205 [Rhodopirellula baltica]
MTHLIVAGVLIHTGPVSILTCLFKVVGACQMNQPEVESVEVEKAPDLPRRRMTVFALVAIAFWTAVADWLIYRTYGYAGPALFFVIAPILILASHWKNAECEPARSRRIWLSVLFVTIAMACLRLVIAGHGGLFVALILLTLAFGLAASGSVPWAAETLMMMFWLPFDGLGWFAKHRLPRLHSAQSDRVSMGATLSWLLPMIAVLVFGSLFVLANPDLLGQVSTLWGWAIDWTWSWAQRLDAWEIPFCVAALILGTGLFFPSLGRTLIGGVDQQSAHQASSPSSMYQPFETCWFA